MKDERHLKRWTRELEERKARRRLNAAAPDLLAACEAAYTRLGDNTNQWSGRGTPEGQRLLINLREAICLATGRDPQEVQDDYCNRAALSRATH